MFFVSALAETNRAPFDHAEGESELVSGYNVEYSAAGFSLFFLGEYSNILLMGAVISILFLGGWLPFYGFSIIPFFFWLPLASGLQIVGHSLGQPASESNRTLYKHFSSASSIGACGSKVLSPSDSLQ